MISGYLYRLTWNTINPVPIPDTPTVATIGNFDGVHLGHQRLIEKLLERAKALKLPAIVVVFEPHPREFLLRTEPTLRIQTLSDKLLKLRVLGVEYVYVLNFNAALAQSCPHDFISNILKNKLHIQELICGEDFRFGKNRTGSLTDLHQAGINTLIVPAIDVAFERISSSKIRTLLGAGEFSRAEMLLGEPYRITGRVIHGAKQGRLLGFPTLNIALLKKMPLTGVYAVKVYGLQENKVLIGVANIGRRPTLNSLAHPLLEVYILNYAADAYQKRICVEFIEKLRDEKKFDSLDALKQQIAEDVKFVEQKYMFT